MKYIIKDNKIILSKSPNTFRNGLKVYFYRLEKHSNEFTDYPVAYADTKRCQTEYEWINGIEVLGVCLKRRKWLFFSYWEELERDLLTNKKK